MLLLLSNNTILVIRGRGTIKHLDIQLRPFANSVLGANKWYLVYLTLNTINGAILDTLFMYIGP